MRFWLRIYNDKVHGKLFLLMLPVLRKLALMRYWKISIIFTLIPLFRLFMMYAYMQACC